MKVLISPISLEEARIVVKGGCDIVDIKNVKEGSLGAQGPWVTKAICEEFKDEPVLCSAALGDLPNIPGTIALASYGAAHCGADYLKAGLYGATNYEEALAMMSASVKAINMVSEDIIKVACGYADFKKFGGVSAMDIVKVAKDSGSDVAMLDTKIKDGSTLFDNLSVQELKDFVNLSHEYGLKTALAGSVRQEHMGMVYDIGCDIIGVRGAVCDGNDRTCKITEKGVSDFVASVREN
ncbi:MAG: hypothetical protein D6B25_05875 [Desulfobulbaceae bacterium]|nr:MAG: hypothetical protein D6B25_05875 [Desulfobulbaceae bacterium]